MENKSKIYSLLVGVNKYQYRRKNGQDINLYGCVNDVNLISETLGERYGLSPEQCLILTDEKATKKNIVGGFEKHLMKAAEGDTAIFYYSGHGSTEKADPRMWVSERDHHNETLVCHDSRSDEPYDLADKELRYLIHQLSQKGVKVVTIIDSCHSGDATRFLGDETDPEEPTVRQTAGSNETRPFDTYIFFDDPKAKKWLNNFSNMPEGEHIALSACRNDQLSKETYFDRTKYGAFTHSLCQSLKLQHFAPSYRNLVDAAAQRVTLNVDNQTPQVVTIGKKFDVHQTFLSDDIQPIIYPVSYHNDSWWLNAGIAQGVNQDARLDLLSGADKVAEVIVSEVSPQDAPEYGSRLAVKSDESQLDREVQYQAQMVDPAVAKLPISFQGAERYVGALEQALENSNIHHYLQPTDSGDYVLEASEKGILFKRSVGLPLAVEPIVGIEGNLSRELVALKLAAHMTIWEHTKNLVYVLREQQIPENLVELVIRQQNPVDKKQFFKIQNEGNEFNLYYQKKPNSNELIKPFIKLSVELNDLTKWPEDEDVFVSLLLMDPAKGSAHVLANKEVLRSKERKEQDGNAKITKHANPVWTYFRKTKRSDRDEVASFSVPEGLLQSNGEGQTIDYLKIIISNFEIDISTLGQTSLQKLLDKLNPDPSKGLRSFDDEEDSSRVFVQKACTQTIAMNIIKPAEPQLLDEYNSAVFSDKVEVVSNSLRAMVSLDYSKDNPAEPTALRIDMDDNSSKSISAESGMDGDTSLTLDFDMPTETAENEGLLVFAKERSGNQDEVFEIPLGLGRYDSQSGKTRVVVNKLPESESEGNRSVGGSILLYFKKVVYNTLKLDQDTARLAIPKFSTPHSLEVSEYVTDVAIIKREVAKADKILLFIHGIIGDTQQMAGVVNREVAGKQIGEGCLALTFDYENLNTPIQETADLLRKKLAAVGLEGDHGKQLVIIAHSMGGLVSRWMLEKDPACPSVEKLVMLGVPNGGSPFKDVKKWLMVMITLATNGVVGVASGIGVAGLMYTLKNVDDTLDEMGRKSKTLEYLYEAKDPQIPYYLIAGDTSELQKELKNEESRLNRLISVMKHHSWLGVTDFFTATLFKEANDIAVGHSSMLHVPKGRKHEMVVHEVDTDHTSYFSHARTPDDSDKFSTVDHLAKILRN